MQHHGERSTEPAFGQVEGLFDVALSADGSFRPVGGVFGLLHAAGLLRVEGSGEQLTAAFVLDDGALPALEDRIDEYVAAVEDHEQLIVERVNGIEIDLLELKVLDGRRRRLHNGLADWIAETVPECGLDHEQRRRLISSMVMSRRPGHRAKPLPVTKNNAVEVDRLRKHV